MFPIFLHDMSCVCYGLSSTKQGRLSEHKKLEASGLITLIGDGKSELMSHYLLRKDDSPDSVEKADGAREQPYQENY